MKISFVIPAYNVGPYIAKCLRSILQQPYSETEVIVIDDGSTDDTAARLEAFKSDKRVKVLSQDNQGQGQARMNGIKAATGDYIWFVDADDWISPHVLPRIVKTLERERPDVFVANYEAAFDDRPSQPSQLVPPHLASSVIDPLRNAQTFAAVSCWQTPPWRLICKRSLVLENEIRFASGLFYEDHPFAIKLMLTARRVYVDPSISYSYYQRSGSTTKAQDSRSLDFLQIRRICLDLFRDHGQWTNLAAVVAGYIVPTGFLNAHVPEHLRDEFISRLRADTSDEELDCAVPFVDQSGNDLITLLRKEPSSLKADSLMNAQGEYMDKAKRCISKFVSSIRESINTTTSSFRAKFETSQNATPALVAGMGTRVDSVNVDIRLDREQRSYVIAGDNSHISGTFVFERGIGQVTVGDRSSIGGGSLIVCSQENGIQIGNHVMISWHCTLIDTNAHSLDPDLRANDAYDWKVGLDSGRMGAYKDWSNVVSAPIIIEDYAWIGFESAILKGVRIGRGAVVGAKSVVSRDVRPFCVVAGAPAKFVGYVPRSTWSWEDIIHASHGDPDMEVTLRNAYLHEDLVSSLKNFLSTEEYSATRSIFEDFAPNAKNILDVGGAGGIMTVAFALAGYHVTLVEPSSDHVVGTKAASLLLEHAARHLDATLSERVDIYCSDLEHFNGRETYDIVYVRQVVHHFRDPIGDLTRIRELLRPDGVAFLLREHVVFDDQDKSAFLAGHPFHRFTNGENAYEVGQYLEFIDAADLEIVKIYRFSDTPINYFPHTKYAVDQFDERDVAGRPYSFVVKRRTPK